MPHRKIALEPLVRRKLADEVTDQLLGDIREGRWSPGDKLPSERMLMEEYAVGRPSIREAMQRLASMGVVEIHHGERATVKTIGVRDMLGLIDRSVRHLLLSSASTLEHLRAARLQFEMGMVRLAAANATDADVASLKDCIVRMESSHGDSDAYLKADVDFHVAIAEISGNSIFIALSDSMMRWIVEYHQEMLRVPGTERVTIQEHRFIVRAIAAHNEDAATAAMADHLAETEKRFRRSQID